MTAPAEYVRTIEPGESLPALVEETKARAWIEEVEFAIVRLITGERIMVRGDRDGIEFLTDQDETQLFMNHHGGLVQVARVYFHTHPRVTGPLDDDFKVLKILEQTRFYIFEIGGEPQGTLVRPK
ncbi:MAG TPA: hypothetical protein VKI65_01195 [Gemmataceae bacterium]|nr:hypothetical protein [Gemmataceae bacterium]